MHRTRWNPTDILARLPEPETGEDRYLVPWADGDTELGFYAPRGTDPQQPHERDEFYFIASGSGTFYHDGERSNFSAGDALFVAAGEEHRFEDFSDDFATWVLFIGPRRNAERG